MKFIACLLSVSCLFLSHLSMAKEYQIEKWEVLDIPLLASEEDANPFTININATATHENGEQQLVPLVYNGDDQWLLRFSASKEGQWTFVINGPLDSLNSQTGTILVTENSDKSNHGGMVLNPDNKQAFYYEDGTPYFLLAYELDWLFALDYFNESDTPKSEHLLSLIKENGFNHIVMNVYAHDVRWDKDAKLKMHPEHEFGGIQEIFPFMGSNENPDFTRLNVEFFQKLDRSVQLLHDKRIVSHLMIYVWNKMVNWPAMNSAADNMYFDYVVKRYQAFPNVVWDISKEALFYGRADEAYIKNRIDRLRAINYFDRLVTVHDYKYCAKYPEQVDFISTQDWGHDIYNLMLNVRKRFPEKPIFNIEHGGYEESPYLVFPGDYVDPEVSVRRNWHSLFAGVYTTYYWQASAWNVIIYNPFEQPEDFIKPRFDYFKSLSTLFSVFEFSDFTPVPNKNGSGYNLVNNEETHLIYVSKDNYQMSRGNWYLRPKKDGVQREHQWFNTLSGEFTDFSVTQKDQKFISPWRGKADAILISRIIQQD